MSLIPLTSPDVRRTNEASNNAPRQAEELVANMENPFYTASATLLTLAIGLCLVSFFAVLLGASIETVCTIFGLPVITFAIGGASCLLIGVFCD